MQRKSTGVHYANRDDIDRVIIGLLPSYRNVVPFSVFLNSFLSSNHFCIGKGLKDELSASDESALYSILNVFFYFRKLSRLGYLETVKMPSIIELTSCGDSSLYDSFSYYIPKEISEYIIEMYNCNLVFSYEYTFYVQNGHVSDELSEARKQTKKADEQVQYARRTLRWSQITVLLSAITILLSVLFWLIPLSH